MRKKNICSWQPINLQQDKKKYEIHQEILKTTMVVINVESAIKKLKSTVHLASEFIDFDES